MGTSKSNQIAWGMAVHVPCEVRNDLFQPVLITNDHTVTTYGIVLDPSLTLFHGGPEGASGNLSAIQE